MRTLPILFLVCLLSNLVHCQDVKFIDSLERHLDTAQGVSRARILYELVNYFAKVDMAKAREYQLQANTIIGSGNHGEETYACLAKGVVLSRSGKLDSAVILYDQARTYAVESRNDHALIRILAALAYVDISLGRAADGLELLFEGLRIEHRTHDPEMEFKLRTNVVWAYLELKQYDHAITQGRTLLSKIANTKFEWIAMYTYNNMAISFGATGKIDSARFYIEKGIHAALDANDNQHVANAYFILGTIYTEAGKFDEAIAFFLLARPYREKVGNPFFLVSDLYTLSDLYHRKREFKNGIATGQEALKLAEHYNLTLKFESVYQTLAQNYEGIGDFRNASKYYRLYAIAKDSVYKNASSEAIAEMQTRFETEKKEQQLELQRAELDKQEAIIDRTYAIIGALAVSLILICVLFILIRGRMRRKQLILEKEKELFVREAQIQASIQSQERERKRFAQDLHDGMGQLISALRLALHQVNKKSSMEDRVEVVDKAEHILNEMYKEIRGIAFNLMPQTLVQEGLISALKEMAGRITGTGKIVVNVTSLDMPDRLPEVQEISIYRIIQEWINNVVKYSHATLIEVQLIRHEEELAITIEDNGKGFDARILTQGGGNGWKNINARTNLIKASIEVDSLPGITGTTLIINVPQAPIATSPVVAIKES